MKLIALASLGFSLLLFGFGTYLKEYNFKELRLFYIYTVFAVTIEILLNILLLLKINNHWVVNYYVPFELTILAFTLISWIKNYSVKWLVKVLVLIFILFWLFILFRGNIDKLSPQLLLLEGFIMVCASGYCLSELMRDVMFSVTNEPKFWITFGILFFFGASFIINSCVNLIYDKTSFSKEFGVYYYLIFIAINIISIIFYLIGFRCHYKQRMLRL